jgi:hypothetical protein
MAPATVKGKATTATTGANGLATTTGGGTGAGAKTTTSAAKAEVTADASTTPTAAGKIFIFSLRNTETARMGRRKANAWPGKWFRFGRARGGVIER